LAAVCPNGTVAGLEGFVLDYFHTIVRAVLAVGFWMAGSPRVTVQRLACSVILLALAC
jgi:hypothetical protein